MTRRIMVSEQFIQFNDEGTSYTGKLARLDPGTFLQDGEEREVRRYTLTNDRAKLVFNGTLNLDKGLEGVKDGEEVEILYVGSDDLGEGRKVKKFEVYVLLPDEDEKPKKRGK